MKPKEMRSVRLYMSAVEKTMIQTNGAPVRDLQMAIGYLSTWDMTFPFVDIYTKNVEEPELLAVYRDELDGPTRAVIGAVLDRHTGNFTFRLGGWNLLGR